MVFIRLSRERSVCHFSAPAGVSESGLIERNHHMHIRVVPHHSESKPFQILNYSRRCDCSATGNFLTNHHLNNDVFSPLLSRLSEGESFHSLERDLHSNSSLRGLESPSSNSMIIKHSHSQAFFSQRTRGGLGGGREAEAVRKFYSLFQAIHPASLHQNSKYFDLQSRSVLCATAAISSQDERPFQSNHPGRGKAERDSSIRA